MKASDLFVRQLETEGVRYIFGIPGEENLDLLESLHSSKTIKLIVTRHEQAAGFMAATQGRLTGEAGVCLSTLGPGATNLVTAAAYAQLGAMPMLMITGQKPIKKSKQGGFQIVDIVHMMQPLTKSARQIVSGDTIPSALRDAFRLAKEERPGAVHLELPEDIAAEETTDSVIPVSQAQRPHADKAAIEKAVHMIQEAKYPLLLIGAGANRKSVGKELAVLIDKTGMYFFDTQMGKGVVDERHPLFLGTSALSADDYLHCAIARSDLIINVGHDVIEKPPFFMQHYSLDPSDVSPDVGQAPATQVIHINFSSAQVDQIYFPQHEIVGDIASSICALVGKVRPQKHWDFSYFEKIKREVENHIAEGTADDRYPLIPQRIVADVRSIMPNDGIITLDNGMYKIWFARNYKAYQANTVLLDNALATMGAGLPSAIAAKLVHPDRKVMAICGDGGFMMNSQELETAIRCKLDIVVLIVRDNAYGMIKWKQESLQFTDFGLDFGNPDFVAYAESYGAKGHRVADADALQSVLRTALDASGVHVVEVSIDYSENNRVLTEELKRKTCIL